MKQLVLSVIILLLNTSALCQVSLNQLNLAYGKHTVGFEHRIMTDSSRTYHLAQKSTNEFIYRPIPVSIWYPSVRSKNGLNIKILYYMEVYKQEKEWELLPTDQILNWFEYPNIPQNRRHLNESAMAVLEQEKSGGKFPVVIYTPGYEGSSVENFALCEFLASHGYIVVASPSRGTDSQFLENGNLKDIETQARDIEFLMAQILNWPNVDHDKIAVMGFSFGGLSNVLAQMKNEKIKAIVSIDGSIKYQYQKLKMSSYFSLEKVDVPFIHLAQKDIPEEILESDQIDPLLNTQFSFYDSLKFSHAYSLKFHDLTHHNFTALGILFKERDQRQDKSDNKIMNSYRLASDYILNFLNAYLLENKESLEYLWKNPRGNGIADGLITKKHKDPQKKSFTFSDFNELALNKDYEELNKLHQQTLSIYPDFDLPEGKLNTVALQWLYNSENPYYGIKILKFATSLYPESSNLFDSLGEGYLVVGEQEKALVNFKEAVRLYPDNFNSQIIR